MDEWSQTDMSQMVNATPAKSDLDDALEVIDKLHHRVVAQMQMEYKAKFDEAQENISLFGEQVFYACPHVSVDSAEAMAYHYVHKLMEGHRKTLELSIHAMEGLTRERQVNAMKHHGIDLDKIRQEQS